MVRVAIAQVAPEHSATAQNLEMIERSIAAAQAQAADIVVLPECAVTGYVYESLDEALRVADCIPGAVSERVANATARHGVYAVVGMLERVGSRAHNVALLAGPSGIEGVYRKTHTLCLGVDRFTTPGDTPFVVHHLPIGRVGILICYDLRFPEPARLLALGGAQMILLPTNWPATSAIQPDVFTRARAAENRVFVLAADRVGEERGVSFLGRSQVIAPDGAVLAEASRHEEEMLVLDIDPGHADEKNVVVRSAEHEMDLFADRRPELYGPLVADPLKVR